MTSADEEHVPGSGEPREPVGQGDRAPADMTDRAGGGPPVPVAGDAEPGPEPVESVEPAPPADRDEPVADAPGKPGDRTERLLVNILAELRKQTGKAQYEDFSIWNLFAGLSQVLVFLSLFMWYLGGHADQLHYLLLAVVLQLMALTFFSAGRN